MELKIIIQSFALIVGIKTNKSERRLKMNEVTFSVGAIFFLVGCITTMCTFICTILPKKINHPVFVILTVYEVVSIMFGVLLMSMSS